MIATLALVTVAGCGKHDTTAKSPTTTASPAAGNGKCVGKDGKPLGSIDATDLRSVVNAFEDPSNAPAAIRDDWKSIGDGYRRILATVGDVNLNDPSVQTALKSMTSDPTFAAALQKIEKYCGFPTGG
jgi:hypothetical protein